MGSSACSLSLDDELFWNSKKYHFLHHLTSKDDLFQVSWPSVSSCHIICLFSIRLSYHGKAGAFQIANSEQKPFRTKDLEKGWVLWHPATPNEVPGAEALVLPASLSKMQNLGFHPTPSPKWLNKNMHFYPQFMSVPTRCEKLFSNWDEEEREDGDSGSARCLGRDTHRRTLAWVSLSARALGWQHRNPILWLDHWAPGPLAGKDVLKDILGFLQVHFLFWGTAVPGSSCTGVIMS